MLLLDRLIVVGELVVFWVVHTVLRVERQRQYFEGVQPQRLIVFPHVHVHSLLICQLLVLFKLVVEFEGEHDFVDLGLGRVLVSAVLVIRILLLFTLLSGLFCIR